MIRLTIDAFSGIPNPSFVLTGADATELLKEFSTNRDVVADLDSGFTGLGFRGVVVEQLADDDGAASLPATFEIGAGGSPADSKSRELAEKVIRLMRRQPSTSPLTDAPLKFDEGLERHLLGLLEAGSSNGTVTGPDGPTPPVPPPLADVTCMIEWAKFNPGFWNAAGVIGKNNCYNYASNRKSDTFAQPGLGAGKIYKAIGCAEVTRAALDDGCHRRYDCFPDTEKSRWLMAMVVTEPGQFADYHWYRRHSPQENFWGHKPGGTAARNVDNGNQVVVNPETCNRGPYVHFCGYFYSCLSQQNRIK